MTTNRGLLQGIRAASVLLVFAALAPAGFAQSTPPPTISLSTTTPEVAIGKSVRIAFKVADADRCVASGAWDGEYLADKTKSGTVTTAALTERVNEFVVVCDGPGGRSSQTLTVFALPKPVVELVADRDRVLPGDSVRLIWTSEDAQSCSASGAPFSGTKETSGSETLSALTKGVKKFTLSCKGVGGTTKVTTEVAVVPAPTLTFSARASQLPQTNTGTQLKWKATDATSCVASGAWTGEQKTSDSFNTGALTAETSDFGLTCTGLTGEVSSTVTVSVVAAPVVTLDLSADVIEPGQNVTISWTVTDAQSCKAGGAPFTGDKNPEGGEEVLSALTKGTKKFKLTCKGGGGTTAAEVALPVVPAPTLTFSARAAQLPQANSGTQLKWKATDATRCIASGAWSGEKPTSGTLDTGTLTDSLNEYGLLCEGPNGEVSELVTIAVVAAPVVTLELSAEVIEPGQNVTISWTVSDAQSCKASGAPFSGDKNPEGGEELLSALTKGTKKFKLACKGGGGTTAVEVTLPVVPAPTLTFSARALQLSEINTGTQLKWKAVDAIRCFASGAWSGERPLSGTFDTSALSKESNDFDLTCVGANGEVTQTVTVEVVPAPYVEFELGAELVDLAGAVDFAWASLYADSCTATGLPWAGKKELSGREKVSGFTQGDKTFVLTCKGPGGSTAVTRKLAVFPAPKILSFVSDKTEVAIGSSARLSWDSTGAESCVATGDWAGAQPVKSPPGGIATPILTQGSNFFGLTCRGRGGETSAEAMVTVAGAPKVTLSASESLIAVGESVTLKWQSSQAVSCTAGGSWSGQKSLSGQETVTPTGTGAFSFELRCQNEQGSFFDRKTVTVEVDQPRLSISPLTMAFDARPVGSESNPRVLRIENISRVPVALGDPVFEGDLQEFVFADIESCGDTLAALTACTVKVSFRPNSGGKKSLRATVTTSGSATPIVLTFTGEGLAPRLTVNVARIDFGSIRVGSSTPGQKITLKNEGSASAKIDAIVLSGDASAFILSSACAPAVDPNSSCDLTLSFSPKTSGEQRARVSITSSGGNAVVDLLGYGQVAASRADAFLKLDSSGLRGVVATVAGSGPAAIEGDGGPALKAGVSEVGGIALANNGDLLIVDGVYIRRIERTTGVIRKFAGNGSQFFDGDGKAAVSTAVAAGTLVTSAQGDVYFNGQARIRRIDPQTGLVSTIAGTGESGFSGDNGPATAAKIQVADLVVDGAGNVFFTDPLNAKIRRIDAATGVITSLALTGVPAGFFPTTIAAGPTGLHVFDEANARVLRINPATLAVSPVAGSGVRGFGGDGGSATAAQLSYLTDMAFDAEGNLFLADDRIVRVVLASNGQIISLAGSSGNLPRLDNGAVTALLPLANGQLLIGVDRGDGFQITGRLFNLDIANKIVTPIAGREDRAGFAGDNGPATSARLYAPTGISVDAQGSIFVGDRLNGRVRRIDGQTNIVTSVATGAANDSPFGRRYPTFTAVAANGDVYYSEWRGHRIMKISPSGLISVVAGTGEAGFSGDGGPASAARLQTPWGLVFDEQGNLYVSTTGRIRRIAPDGVITTIAGCCDVVPEAVDPRDGGLAVNAYLNGGNAALAYFKGKLYLQDAANGNLEAPTIREIDLVTGRIRRIAGNGQNGQSLASGLALNSPLGQIFGLAVDSIGNVYVSETTSNRISRINPTTGEIRAVAGGRLGYEGDGGTALDAAVYTIQGMAFDRRGNLYFADRTNHVIRVVLCVASPVAGEASDCDPPSANNPVRRALLQWNQVGVDQCEAIGAWSGPRATSGAEWLPVSNSGEQSYGLRCTKSDGSVSLFESVLNNGVVTPRSAKSAKLESTSIFFGEVAIGQSGASRTLRVSNTSASAITFESIRLIGSGSASFASTSSCVGPIVAGGSCEVRLTFSPKASGEQLAQIEIASGSLKLLASLSGNGEVSAVRDQSALKLAPTASRGVIATYAGSGPAAIEGDGGPALRAGIANIRGLVTDAEGSIYIADDDYIREISTADGLINRLGGNGEAAFDGDGRTALLTSMSPRSLVIGPQGEGYFLDDARIRRIDGNTGVVTTVAGNGTPGYSGDGAAAIVAAIRASALTIDPSGNLYFSDPTARVIRRVDASSRIITTVAVVNAPQNFTPGVLAFGPGGLHVFDEVGLRLHRINADGSLTAVLGTGSNQYVEVGSTPVSTGVGFLVDVRFDRQGSLYYLDAAQRNLRVIANYGSTQASAQRVAWVASFNELGNPVAFDFLGTNALAVAVNQGDGFQMLSRVYRVDLSTRVMTAIAGRNERAGFGGDGGAANQAKLYGPTGVALDVSGNLFIGDRINGYLRRVDSVSGLIDSVRVGNTNNANQNPTLTAVAANGDVYYSEWRNHRVMKVDWKTKAVSVVAGTGQAGYSGDGGSATSARIQSPWGLAFDDAGNLYISTAGRIRRVTPQGVISTIAGCCDLTDSVVAPRDGALAINAYLNGGYSSLVHHAGKLYLQDAATPNYEAPTIREIDLSTGVIRRVAGNGQFGPSNTSGLALSSPLGQILGLAVDSSGNLYFAETTSSRISRIDLRTGEIRPVVAGRLGFSGDGGSATRAAIYSPQAMAFDRRGNLYFADRANHRVRVVLCVGAPVIGELSDCDPASALSANRRVLVQWNQINADNCEAVGAWSGPRAANGAVWVPANTSGEQSYGLRCAQADGSVSLLESVVNGATVTERAGKSLKLETATVFFGPTLVGQTSSSQVVRIRNTGAAAVSIDTLRLSGAASASFTVSGNCSNVDSGATCDLTVTFSPKATGEQTATLEASSGLLMVRTNLTGSGEVVVPRDQAFVKVAPVAQRGIIATVAGSGPAALDGDGGPALAAGIARVAGMAFNERGDLFVADGLYIRQIDQAGVIRRIAGTGSGWFDGDGRPGLQTAINPANLLFGVDGAGYFIDRSSGPRIRRIDAVTGIVTTIAGTGVAGNSGDGGPAISAQIRAAAMTRDSAGNLYFSDPGAGAIRRIDLASKTISSLSLSNVPNQFVPTVLAFGPRGLHVFDETSYRVYLVSGNGALEPVVGNGTLGASGDGGLATNAQIGSLQNIAFDSNGAMYLSDIWHWQIRKIANYASADPAQRVISTLTGTGGEPLVMTTRGSELWLALGEGYFQNAARLYRVDTSSGQRTVVAGRGDQATFAGDGGPATLARLNTPTGVTIDPTTGDLLITDRMNGRVRRVVAATSTMGSSVETGQTPYVADSERPRGKRYPIHTAVAANGDIYYSEWRGHRVMKIDPATKAISIVAGTGEAGYSGDGGSATAAKLDSPWGLALDEQGNLYVSTIGRVRKITPSGVITTIAGCCDVANSPTAIVDGGLATLTRLNGGNSALAYRNGKLYVQDSGSALQLPFVLEIDLTRGTIRRAAGNGSTGQAAIFGSALSTPLGQLSGLAVDAAGDVFIADFSSNSISRVRMSDGEFRLIAGGRQGFAGDGGSATAAALNLPQGLAVDRRGNLYFADRSNQRVRVVMCAGQPEVGEVSDCDPAAATRPNRRVLVQWNQLGVTQCEAVGSWSGTRASAGAEWLPVGMVGSQSYGLLCTGADGSRSLTETVINGSDVVEKPTLRARLEGSALTFGSVTVGNSSAAQKLTLRNLGGQTLTLDSVGLMGQGSASFVLSNNCASTLAPNASCEIEVVFRPKSSGDQRAEVVVGSGALKLTSALVGTADAPPPASGIVIDTVEVNFGSLRVGSVSAPRFVRLRNVGQTTASFALSVTGIDPNEIDLNSGCGTSLDAGAECEIALILQPASVGSKTGQLVVRTANEESSVALRGRVGQSENQFICRATPEQTEPAPRSNVLDVIVNSVSNEDRFVIEYTPVPGVSSYPIVLRWDTPDRAALWTLPSDWTAYCPRIAVDVLNTSSSTWSISKPGECLIQMTVPIIRGTSKATVSMNTDGRSATDSVILGELKPAAPIVTASAQNGVVSLSWLPVPTAIEYFVYRLDGNTATKVGGTLETSLTLTGLTLDSAQTYAVKARSNAGLSTFSAPVTMTPRATTSTSVVVEDIRINQAVEVTSGSSTKLIAGKPGIVEVYLNVTGDEIGMPGIVRLQAPGLEPVEIFGPLLHTPTSVGAGAACVATFDLRDDAATWFAAGTRNLMAEVEVLGRPIEGPVASAERSFSFVEERPLYVKLIPVNSIRGNPTSSEIELAKTSIEKQIRSMYPNRNPQIVLSASPYQFTGTNAGNGFLSDLLPAIRSLRLAELSNSNCDRFYYALHKDNLALGSRTVGLAYVPNPEFLGTCPSLAGVGVIEFPLTVDTTAHEIGHNHGRSHVGSAGETNDRCGAPGDVDLDYPHPFGRIGVTGYDSAGHRSLSKNLFHDIMGYCSRNWISDYQYQALRSFQESLSVLPRSVSARMIGESGGILFSGSIDAFGVWKLDSRLILGGSRLANSGAARGFTAIALLSDGSEQSLPLEIVDIDHISSRDFSIWLPNGLAATEIVVRSPDGVVVFRQDLASGRMVAARTSSTSAYRLEGNVLELLPWGSGDRLVIRIRNGEREFVGNDNGEGSLRFVFATGDIFEVMSTLSERRLSIGPLTVTGSAREIDSATPDGSVESADTTAALLLNEISGSGAAATAVGTRDPLTSSLSDGSVAGEAAAIEMSRVVDSTTGGRYVLSRSTKAGPDGYGWVLGYRSNGGALLNQWGLQSTAGVLWRLADETSRSLGSSGWVAICSGQVWVVRDGYQLLAGRTDRGLIERNEQEIRIGSGDRAKVVESVSCRTDGGVTVVGYSLPVSADSPALRLGAVAATRFELELGPSVVVETQRVTATEFDLGAYCASPVAVERGVFCAQAGLN